MMNTLSRNILSLLDNTVRRTGMPNQVNDDISETPSVDRKHRRFRWIPFCPIAFSCVPLILSLSRPSELHLGLLASFGAIIMSMVLVIHLYGPLGKSAVDDDERETALRKDSFLFCLGLLAFLNCLGQPILMILSHLQSWQTTQSVSVAGSAFVLNATLLACLPTLYASWNLRKLPNE